MTTRTRGHNGIVPIRPHFEWNLEHAKVAQANTTFTMQQGIRSRMTTWPAPSPFNSVTDGAVVIRGVRWRLSNLPIPC